MPYTMEDFKHDVALEHLSELTTEERLQGLSIEEILQGLSIEEILKTLSIEQREALLKQINLTLMKSDDLRFLSTRAKT